METELWKQSYRLPNNLFAMGSTIFELWVMKTENWVTEFANPNNPNCLVCSIKDKQWEKQTCTSGSGF